MFFEHGPCSRTNIRRKINRVECIFSECNKVKHRHVQQTFFPLKSVSIHWDLLLLSTFIPVFKSRLYVLLLRAVVLAKYLTT